jgi:hypothetical protein
MQNSTSSNKYTPRGGRPNYRYARWTPPPEPKPEPKLDLSDKSFPSLSNNTVPQTTAVHTEFKTSFATSVKVMAEVEKLHELRAERDRQADQRARAELSGVYIQRFQPGRLSELEPEEPQWRRALRSWRRTIAQRHMRRTGERITMEICLRVRIATIITRRNDA